ncbi:MAG: NAD(P)-dependent oxidoreductase [Clostridiales bacterium]|nr:NAD(P)-dependent oxidoreductase [Clostridiales bacterium]
MNALIGYTGFVGTNLMDKGYNHLYNSKNIYQIAGNKYDTIVCAGIRAEKFLANKYPEQDLEAIQQLIDILKQVECKKFVLISTIDIYKNPIGVDETTPIELKNLHPYGRNRYYMEEFVRNHYKDYLIVRLPALFGKGLKKNFIYDMIHKIPSMIMSEKYNELLSQATEGQRKLLEFNYVANNQGNWVLKDDLDLNNQSLLREALEQLGFTSLVFTDCRSRFPFYDLSNLQDDIDMALKNHIKELNIAVEPISAQEVAKECFNIEFSNMIDGRTPIYYDIKSIHTKQLSGDNGYLYSKQDTIQAIQRFLQN